MGTPAEPVTGLPVALSIAGSDSSGGAGIQADLKVFFALGCHGTSALTAVTAQNTVGVTAIHPIPPDVVVQQIAAVDDDLDVAAAKTGMLASADIVEAVATALSDRRIRTVVDPVFVSKHGDSLLATEAVTALKEALFPFAEVITPNLHEASALLGREVTDLAEMRSAAAQLHAMGPRAVLVKGGHLPGDRAIDIFYDGDDMKELDGPQIDTRDTHGTGCALSAAIAARLALGDDPREAVGFAKTFVSGAIRHGLRLGQGYGPVNPGWALPGAAGS